MQSIDRPMQESSDQRIDMRSIDRSMQESKASKLLFPVAAAAAS
jgi:hypothetical protein